MANKIERLTFTRRRLAQDIARQEVKIQEFNSDTDIVILLSRKEALEELWSDFRANTELLESARDWVGTDEYISENATVHESYLNALSKITKLIPAEGVELQQSLTMFQQQRRQPVWSENENDGQVEDGTVDPGISNTMHSSTPAGHAFQRLIGMPTTIKLPPLQIKPFNGKLIDWPEFKATCESTFASLTDEVSKFRYLKSFLVDEPAQLIKHLPLITGSYNKAWEMLRKRYDNERAIINANLKRLFDMERLTLESAHALRNMLNTTNECIAAIEGYGIETESWDSIMIFILTRQLDSQSVQYWEESIQGRKTVPKLAELTDFLEMRINILETTAATKAAEPTPTPMPQKPKVFVTTTNGKKCTICKQDHFAYKCPQLAAISEDKKTQFILERKLCMNCLFPHNVEECKSKFSCRTCGQRHHTTLHPPERVHNIIIDESIDPEELQAQEMHIETILQLNEASMGNEVKLATAVVRIEHGNHAIYARALIDQGATANLVTKRIAEALSLPQTDVGIPIMSICNAVSYNVKKRTTLSLKPRKKQLNYELQVPALIVPKITSLPDSHGSVSWSHLEHLDLADPEWQMGGRIDVLLGASAHAEIILDGLVKGKPGELIAQRTELGWMISGGNGNKTHESIFTIMIGNEQLSQSLQRFWESEEIPRNRMFTPDEQKAEDIFVQTTQRCSDGRFMVRLPFKNETPSLGESKLIATKRFESTSKRLLKNPELKAVYDASLQEYLDLGQMERVKEDSWPHCYLPHHPVFKASSTTTKVRAVYDASCKTSNGNSLNSQLLIGPTIQSDLFSTLIRWRKYKYAITGDIEKMYRQIWVHPWHTEFQRILWDSPETDKPESYRLKTVTFGVASAPFLAIRTLFLIADEIKKNSPEMADKIKYQFYVDDFFDSADTIKKAKETVTEISNTLSNYGFSLRKWKANTEEILNEIADNEKDSSPSNVFKTLGVQWQPATDEFVFVPAELKENKNWTKRSILSDISKLFDPLGWLSPCVIVAKIFMQRLWLIQADWDEQLPPEITKEWLRIQQQFMVACAVKVPRWIGLQASMEHVSLQGFCDASEKAIASVVFIRIQYGPEHVECKLIAAKTRVAPLKKLSIPRLELNGAVLLASLIEKVKDALKMPEIEQHAWTDSEIVLHWLANHPGRWKTFVANRVSEVQGRVPSHHWRHISSAQNPADCASRGMQREELETLGLWWHGPAFLLQPEKEWPKTEIGNPPANIKLEEKPQCLVATIKIVEPNALFKRFSSYERLLRVSTHCFRWLPSGKSNRGNILCDELVQTEIRLIKLVQEETFTNEIHSLQKREPLWSKSALHGLDPFIDNDGLLRVGGRIQRANMSENEKHPIILPPKHPFTRLLIQQAHDQTYHGGFALMSQKLRQKYWIINNRNEIKAIIHKCVICFRYKRKLLIQKMGDLPDYRLQETIPFTFTGVDYAGYFDIKSSQRKNAPFIKGYVAVFVCLTTRAVHLEMVSDLSTTQFLKAFKRFISRRGIPSRMFSDNATNFVGADREIQLSLEQAREQSPELQQMLLANRIQWSNIPARAPHFGGWESSVKLMKHHLKRVLGNVRLCFEDFNTLITEIEAIVNSRPLWSSPTRLDEFEALTPGHFLIGKALNTLPEANLDHVPLNRLNHYQYLQRLRSEFWRIWSCEYIHTLQTRKKWKNIQPNVRTEQIVLIAEDNEAPSVWSLGKILKVYPGRDGLVRTADVICREKVLRRPIHKLGLLPIPDNEGNSNEQAST